MSSAPRVGQPVHYMARGSADGVFPPVCRAAIITDVDGPQPASAQIVASLAVLNPSGLFFDQHLHYSEDKQPGTWHYPCPPTETPAPQLAVVTDPEEKS